jgi:hypothetical protein
MVFSNPVAGKVEEYEEWYDHQHFEDLLAIPGFVAVQRFRLTDTQSRPGEHPHRYAVIWEIETDDLQAVFDELTARREKGTVVASDAFDYSTSISHTFEPVTERVTKEMAEARRT